MSHTFVLLMLMLLPLLMTWSFLLYPGGFKLLPTPVLVLPFSIGSPLQLPTP
jgi:hypothetical protein